PPSDSDPIAASSGSAPDACATERKGKFQYTDDNPAKGLINRDYRLETCPQSALIPLTADKQQLFASIEGFQAQGHTAGHIGIQWAWYMVSPIWKKYVPAGSIADPYGKKTRKFVIIMTDGEFNTAYAGVPKWDSVKDQADRSMSN